MARGVSLLFHFIGLSLLVTTLVAGFILDLQYKKAKDIQAKAVILGALRPIGLLSPLGMVIMLITGIVNMQMLGIGLLTFGWLTAKIIFFAIAVISGTLFGVKSRKRSTLVQSMAAGNAPANAEDLLRDTDKQLTLFYVVMPILLLIILSLAIIGRLGAQ